CDPATAAARSCSRTATSGAWSSRNRRPIPLSATHFRRSRSGSGSHPRSAAPLPSHRVPASASPLRSCRSGLVDACPARRSRGALGAGYRGDAVTHAAAEVASEALRSLGDRFWEGYLSAYPTWATVIGDRRFDDRLEDVSP